MTEKQIPTPAEIAQHIAQAPATTDPTVERQAAPAHPDMYRELFEARFEAAAARHGYDGSKYVSFLNPATFADDEGNLDRATVEAVAAGLVGKQV